MEDKIPNKILGIHDEVCPSNRTSCLLCKKTIKLGETRLNVRSGTCHGTSTYTRYHSRCFCSAMLPYVAINVIREIGVDKFDEKIMTIFKKSIVKHLKKE